MGRVETPAPFLLYKFITMEEKATKPEVKVKAVEAKAPAKPEPIVMEAESASPVKPEPVTAPEPAPAPEPEKPKAEPEPALAPEKPKADTKLFEVNTDTYKAWVTKNSDTSFLANLELAGGSAYNWSAGSASEAEDLLKYHIANQKL